MADFSERDYERAAWLETAERESGAARLRATPQGRPVQRHGQRVCADCLEPIARARLEAQPGAVRCIECQDEVERRERLWA